MVQILQHTAGGVLILIGCYVTFVSLIAGIESSGRARGPKQVLINFGKWFILAAFGLGLSLAGMAIIS